MLQRKSFRADSSCPSLLEVWAKCNAKEPNNQPTPIFVNRSDSFAAEKTFNEAKFEAGICSYKLKGTGRHLFLIEDYVQVWNKLAADPAHSLGKHANLFEVTILFMFDDRTAKLLFYSMLYHFLLHIVMRIVDPSLPMQISDAILWLLMITNYYTLLRIYKSGLGSSIFSGSAVYSGAGSNGSVELKNMRGGRTSSTVQRAALTLDSEVQSPLYVYDGKIPYKSLTGLFLKLICRAPKSLCGYCSGTSNEPMRTETIDQRFNDDANEPANQSGLSQTIELNNFPSSSKSISGVLEGAMTEVDKTEYTYLLNHTRAADCKYYLLLNVGLKFLEDFTSMTECAFGRRSDFIILLFALCTGVMVTILEIVDVKEDICVFGSDHAKENTRRCLAMWIYTFGSGCFMLNFIHSCMMTTAVAAGAAGLWHGSCIMHGLASSWVQRFGMFRTLSAASLTTNDEESGGNSADFCNEIAIRLRRDAFEHYLVLREFATQISVLWSNQFLGTVIVDLIFTGAIVYAIYAFSDKNVSVVVTYLPAGVLIAILVMYAISSVAYANQAVNVIEHMFKHCSADDDFALLGGRKMWMKHLIDSPAQWTIHGFVLTWNTLYAALASFVTTMGGFIIAAIVSTEV